MRRKRDNGCTLTAFPYKVTLTADKEVSVPLDYDLIDPRGIHIKGDRLLPGNSLSIGQFAGNHVLHFPTFPREKHLLVSYQESATWMLALFPEMLTKITARGRSYSFHQLQMDPACVDDTASQSLLFPLKVNCRYVLHFYNRSRLVLLVVPD